MRKKEQIDIRKIDAAVPDKTPDGSGTQIHDNSPAANMDKMAGCGPVSLGDCRAGTNSYVTHGILQVRLGECGGKGVIG
jgi:hypothetical protein